MGLPITPSTARALKAAGIDVSKLRGEKGKRQVRQLPSTSVLLPDPARVRRRHEVTLRGRHPTRLNVLKSVHWAVERKLKYSDACWVGGELRAAGVAAAWGMRRVGLVIALGPRQRGGDGDAYWKALLDGLKRCGALVDDNRQWCELMPVRYERQSEMSTRIILEDQ